jgi:hypothetical protein
MINLHQDIGGPVYFIRYNPDQYRVDSKVFKPTDNTRKKVLTKWIEEAKSYGAQGLVEEGLHILYLFYDGYQQENGWETIKYI